MPGVADVRVLAAPDARRGQQIVACIVADAGDRAVSALAVRRFCAARLAPHKIPRTIVFLDAMPLTARGKIDRAALDELVRAAQIDGSPCDIFRAVCVARPSYLTASTRNGRESKGSLMNLWKPVELALTGGARLLWPAFQAINRRVRRQAVPAEVGRRRRCSRAASARSRSSAGRARPIRSARPACARRARASCRANSRSSRSSTSTSARSRRTSSSATARSSSRRPARVHGTFADTLAINPAFLRRLESLFPGRDFPAVTDEAAQPRHLVHQVRPRRGADDRPDQPLQHDVRSVLHGRQSGRLRPRADASTKSKSCSTMRSASSRGGR